jgi:hypothetical protein
VTDHEAKQHKTQRICKNDKKKCIERRRKQKVQFLADLVLKRGGQLIELQVVKFSPS